MAKTFEELMSASANNDQEEAINKLKADCAAKYINTADDERFWKPKDDKAGNGDYLIRFLPAPKNETAPLVKQFKHHFQTKTGKWYMHKSLLTIGKPDPVDEMNKRLLKSDKPSDHEQAKQQKVSISYVANILVMEDKFNPDHKFKVCLYRFPIQVFNKLSKLPEFYDLLKGSYFRLKWRRCHGFRNYDKSAFIASEPLAGGDPAILKNIWEKQYPLQPFIDEKNFPTYEVLQKELIRVFGPSYSPVVKPAEEDNNEDNPFDDSGPEDEVAEAEDAIMDDGGGDISEFIKRQKKMLEAERREIFNDDDKPLGTEYRIAAQDDFDKRRARMERALEPRIPEPMEDEEEHKARMAKLLYERRQTMKKASPTYDPGDDDDDEDSEDFKQRLGFFDKLSAPKTTATEE